MVGESTLYHSVCRKFLKAPALCDRPESSDGSQHRAGRLGPLPPDATPQEATPASACGGGLAGRPKVRPRAGALPRRRAHPEAGRTRGFEVSTGRQARPHQGPPPRLGAQRELSLREVRSVEPFDVGFTLGWGV